MTEKLTKLRPDRDLQCYFQQPSAIAALSETSQAGFTVSGCWRQQFDWAVVEWARDNVFEHPALRNLPDGDLSNLRLTYEETRFNCVPIDSTIYDGLGWSYLRIWEQADNGETLHWVPLRPYATPVHGDYVSPTATLELEGAPTAGDQIELSWLDQHCSYVLSAGDSLASALSGLASVINGDSQNMLLADVTGNGITLTYIGAPGMNGNRVGVYGTVHGARTEQWSPEWAMFTGGQSPDRWRIELDFSNLFDKENNRVNTSNVRKMRWTWMADIQFGPYTRSEFQVLISNWSVTGSGLQYQIAGPGSWRIEASSPNISYLDSWAEERGNYSGGSIRRAIMAGAQVRYSYSTSMAHTLYVGTRYVDIGPKITVQVDLNAPQTLDLNRNLEDVQIRVPLAQLSGGATHTVVLTHSGTSGTNFYFNFFEIAVPTATVPIFGSSPTTTLATDWDTDHSIAIAPERTAWIINTLGFKGRANHYAGAMWFYELSNSGTQYASASIEFSGTPEFGEDCVTDITIGGTVIQHRNLIGDTAETITKCFELLITAGASSVWARADGTKLYITAREFGTGGNAITVGVNTHSQQFTATVSAAVLTGGLDGQWLTDLNATPRLNRAARDWSRSYFRALCGYGIDVVAAFSMELRHGDDSFSSGIAQRYLAGPCRVNTPALQTNFSPTSIDFWKQVYLEMATIMSEAGVSPYLQFGEVQWWYFDDGQSMPFYDAYTKQAFEAAYGRPMRIIQSQNADPADFTEECVFLPILIGNFTQSVMKYVRQQYPLTRFEVLYPPDVNDTPLNRIINFPKTQWTPEALNCLKTENFTYTGDRNLNKVRDSISLPSALGFPASKSSHLIGISDYTTPWNRERRLATGVAMESVVLFALDQFCLVGYRLPLDPGPRRARFLAG